MTLPGYNHKFGQNIMTDIEGVDIDRAFLAHYHIDAADAVAASSDGVHAAMNLSAAVQAITTGITNPAVPRNIRIDGNVSGITGKVKITGTNYAGEEIEETITANGTDAADGDLAFRTVTQIDLPVQNHTPALQQETITVTHACTQDGTLVVSVTGAALGAASPVSVNVDVTTADAEVEDVAVKIRAALTADPDISAAYTVGGTDGAVLLTAKAYAANDTSLELAMVDAPATGVTVGASGNTTAGVLGVAQVETIEVTAGAGGAGTLVFTVTGTAMGDASPKAVNVPVTGDDIGEVATKIRAALTADADVGAAFTVSGADGNVILTAKEKVANDDTLEMALTDADGTGVTVGASGNTTPGVLPVLQKETITVTHAATAQGTLVVTVTAANMDHSPKAVNVNVDEEDNTVTLVANKIRTALAADADVGGFFTVSGSAGEINLTAKTDADNDVTMAIALSDAPTTAVTVGASVNTTPGVPYDQISVGWGDKFGLPYMLYADELVILKLFGKAVDTGTVTNDADELEKNVFDPNGTPDGLNDIDLYIVV